MTPEQHLRDYWDKVGIIPPEDFWLLYDARQTIPVRLLWKELAISVVLLATTLASIRYPFLSVLSYLLFMVVVGIVPVYFWHIAWRFWLVHLYGVETWDLKMILWLARWLGMREPQRE